MGKSQSTQANTESTDTKVNNNHKETASNGSVDASKVKVSGVGLQHGIITEYEGRFSVETTGAGSGNLNVKVNGPKGGFRVETYREHDYDRIVSCRYDPVETGMYEIHVTFSGTDVPGSPFKIYIAESEKKLKKMIKDGC